MSSEASPQTPNDLESDIEFSVYSLSSDLDLDFGFRGTTKPFASGEPNVRDCAEVKCAPEPLLVLTAKAIALQFPFEVVESSPLNVPEELQRLIAFHSFPTDEDDICLYSCLSSGGSYEFDQGEALWADKAVKDCVQIGFHLSATVLTSLHFAPTLSGQPERPTADQPPVDRNQTPPAHVIDPFHVNFSWNPTERHAFPPDRSQPDQTNDSTNRPGVNIEPAYPAHRVSLTFDRGRITSCSCTCTFDSEDGCANLASSRTFYDEQSNAPGVGQHARSDPVPSEQPFSYQLMDDADDNNRLDIVPTFSEVAVYHMNRLGIRVANNGSRLLPSRSRHPLPSSSTHRQSDPSVPTAADSAEAAGGPSTSMPPDPAGGHLANSSIAAPGTWCSHVVATCLFRIRQPNRVLLRAPISESLSKLSKEDLQKFAQNLICHVGPKKILPAAQRILDQLLDSADNPLKNSLGAPDPTAGGAVGDAAAWCFDGAVLEEKLRVTLKRFWDSNPSVIYSDIGSLNAESPVDVENFQCVLHSLRGNDPRGVWDLLSIIGDMMRRQDNNGVLLLEIVTRCLIDMPELMLWWYSVQTKSALSLKSLTVCQKQSRYAALWLCEEIVQLWRLACLNPDLRASPCSPCVSRFPSGSSSLLSNNPGRDWSGFQLLPAASGSACWLLQQLTRRLSAFHVYALQQAGSDANPGANRPGLNPAAPKTLPRDCRRKFVGFKPALAACYIRWPPELPPTYAMSVDEFRACLLPAFTGAHVTPGSYSTDLASHTHFSLWTRSSKTFPPESLLPDPLSSEYAELLADIPFAQDETELAFARFQALDSHGHSKQALPWARYLACRLLHLSPVFVAQLESVSFDIAQQSCRLADASDADPRGGGGPRQRTTPGAGLSSPTSADSHGGSGRRPGAGLARSSSQTQETCSPLSEELLREATDWASKTSHLLDQIRCLMECLTRSYQESMPAPVNVTSVNRITTNGRSLLTFRGPDPALLSLHLDDTASPIAQPAMRSGMTPIKDQWMRLDIELAFRLGLYGLSLPRPPTGSPTFEVRLFDQEVALVNRMCGLPLHIACPEALQTIRTEATLLARSSSLYQTDLLVPYNLAAYLFHQLVGTRPLSLILDHLSDPSVLLASTNPTNSAVPATTSSDATGPQPAPTFRCPVLTTGAILGGSGLPLAVSIHIANQSNQPGGFPPRVNATGGGDLAHDLSPLQQAVVNDADLGFAVALTVLGPVSRVPQSLYPFYMEAQWAQRDALVVYLCRHYRDDVAKLDRILLHLLDRHYNADFKAPPLWACLSLAPHDLLHYYSNNTNNLSDSTVPEETRPHSSKDGQSRSTGGGSLRLGSPPKSNPEPTAGPSAEPARPAREQHADSEGGLAHTSGGDPHTDNNSSLLDSSKPPLSSPDTSGQPCAGEPTSTSEDTDTLPDSRIYTALFHRGPLSDARNRIYHSVGMAAVDTSAPETTSSDNSPTTGRRLFGGRQLLPSTSASAGVATPAASSSVRLDQGVKASSHAVAPQSPAPRPLTDAISSDLIPSVSRVSRRRKGRVISSSEDDDPSPSRLGLSLIAGSEAVIPETTVVAQDPVPPIAECPPPSGDAPDAPAAAASEQSTSGPPTKRLPLQPLSDSMAFHLFHLAKYVRKLAGGPSANESMFVAESEANAATVHRNLQLVAFQIGLYGLGLYNGLFPSWQSRTYSRYGSWISQQVFELGIPAACMLYHSWRQHLTPTELATIAFQLSRENDQTLIDIAMELCLASLAHCATLRPQEVYRALGQCEAHSTAALEQGLLKIEDSDRHTTYGILPEILFHLARCWFSLHQTTQEAYKEALRRAHVALRAHHEPPPQQQQPPQQEPQHSEPTHRPEPVLADTTTPGPINMAVAISPTNDSLVPARMLDQTTAFAIPTGAYYSLPAPPAPTFILPADPNFPVFASHFSFGPTPLIYYQPYPLHTNGNGNTAASPQLFTSYPPPTLPPQAQNLLSNQTPAHYPPQAIPYAAHPSAVINPLYRMGPYSATIRPIIPLIPQPFIHPASASSSSSSYLIQSAAATRSALVPLSSGGGGGSASVGLSSQLGMPQAANTLSPDGFNMLVQMPPPPPQVAASPAVVGSGVDQPTYSAVPTSGYMFSTALPSSDMPPPQPPFVAGSALRATPMSNASGSMVVHPATSDQASSTMSEAESSSYRPTAESVADDSHPAGRDGAAAAAAAAEQPSSTEADSQSSEALIKTLQSKSFVYLRRAYHCATGAIKKICQTSTTTGSQPGSSVASSSADGTGRTFPAGRGAKSHHSHGTARQRHSAALPAGQSSSSRGASTASTSLDYAGGAGGGPGGMLSHSAGPLVESRGGLRVPLAADPLMVKGLECNILWALDVASSLGPSAVHDYCNLVLQCVYSPLLMNEITLKVIEYFKSLEHTSERSALPPHIGIANSDCPTEVSNRLPESHASSHFMPGTSNPPHHPHPWTHNSPRHPTDNTPDFLASYHQQLTPAAAAASPHAVWFQPTTPDSLRMLPPLQPTPLRLRLGTTDAQLAVLFAQLGVQQNPPAPRLPGDANTGGSPPPRLAPENVCPPPRPPAMWQSPSWMMANSASAGDMPQAATSTATTGLSMASAQHQANGRELIERLINRTHSLFHKFIDQCLQLIGPGQTDWDEFVDLILKAYHVHLAMPATDSGLHWNNLLTRIRRHQKCSSALWQRILAGIQTADLKRTAV